MAKLTALHGPRPVATVPSGASYRIQPGRLVTVAGHVRASAVTGLRSTTRPEAADKAA